MRIKQKRNSAQVIVEFTFSLIMVLLILYGIVKVIRWSGVSLADRRIEHDRILNTNVPDNFPTFAQGPLRQVYPDFYNVKDMNLIFNNW